MIIIIALAQNKCVSYIGNKDISYVYHNAGVRGVPSTRQPSCGTELVKVEKGSALSLHCGSYCPERSSTYHWWKVTKEERVKLSFSESVVREDGVSEESGGEYECQCGTNGQICTFYVAGIDSYEPIHCRPNHW